jgi:hypothetical protein
MPPLYTGTGTVDKQFTFTLLTTFFYRTYSSDMVFFYPETQADKCAMNYGQYRYLPTHNVNFVILSLYDMYRNIK